jgi:hypothetical protein
MVDLVSIASAYLNDDDFIMLICTCSELAYKWYKYINVERLGILTIKHHNEFFKLVDMLGHERIYNKIKDIDNSILTKRSNDYWFNHVGLFNSELAYWHYTEGHKVLDMTVIDICDYVNKAKGISVRPMLIELAKRTSRNAKSIRHTLYVDFVCAEMKVLLNRFYIVTCELMYVEWKSNDIIMPEIRVQQMCEYITRVRGQYKFYSPHIPGIFIDYVITENRFEIFNRHLCMFSDDVLEMLGFEDGLYVAQFNCASSSCRYILWNSKDLDIVNEWNTISESLGKSTCLPHLFTMFVIGIYDCLGTVEGLVKLILNNDKLMKLKLATMILYEFEAIDHADIEVCYLTRLDLVRCAGYVFPDQSNKLIELGPRFINMCNSFNFDMINSRSIELIYLARPLLRNEIEKNKYVDVRKYELRRKSLTLSHI